MVRYCPVSHGICEFSETVISPEVADLTLIFPTSRAPALVPINMVIFSSTSKYDPLDTVSNGMTLSPLPTVPVAGLPTRHSSTVVGLKIDKYNSVD